VLDAEEIQHVAFVGAVLSSRSRKAAIRPGPPAVTAGEEGVYSPETWA
jgi:hypothetical protein